MNTLSATITAVTTSKQLSLIQVSAGDDTLYLLLAEGSNEENLLLTSVTLAFKETEVILAKERSQTTANVLKGTVREIQEGIILSQILLNYQETTITALVPTLTFRSLNIKEEDEVVWMVQPSEISLLRGSHGI
ncbi:MAG TPA: hypothetical protein VFX68_08140 [Sulfuricurvum sp.]|nr:hypothetical protein [Sulfuricurvum sp.]